VSTWNAPTDPEHPALQQPWLYFAAGVALALGLHLALALAVSFAAWLVNTPLVLGWLGQKAGTVAFGLWTTWWMGLSISQLLYLGPAWLVTRTWRPPMAQGILVVAVITFLLQGSCYAFFLTALAAGMG
jgi:hypothetical protein